MTTFQKFEEIEAWQLSRVLVRRIREICKRPNAKKDFIFIDQITRAARSISANIAEGSDARGEFIKFLSYAKRSGSEVKSHLYDALDEGYISKAEFDELYDLADKVVRMIGRLMIYLHNAKRANA